MIYVLIALVVESMLVLSVIQRIVKIQTVEDAKNTFMYTASLLIAHLVVIIGVAV